MEKLTTYTIQVEISPDAVVTSLRGAAGWRELDRWRADREDFTVGKFGFVVEKNKNLLLHGFRYQPAGEPAR